MSTSEDRILYTNCPVYSSDGVIVYSGCSWSSAATNPIMSIGTIANNRAFFISDYLPSPKKSKEKQKHIAKLLKKMGR